MRHIPNLTDDWDELQTDYAFRVRFAPPLNGEWKASIHIRINKEQTPSFISNDFWFNVVESGDPGYVKVYENYRNLKQGDKMIFPVGTNFPADFDCVAWGGTCYNEIPGDPVRRVNKKDVTDTIYYGHNLQSDSTTEKASNVYAWNKYLNTLSEYFQSGGKYIRTLQFAWSTLIEYEHKGNYYKRLHYAWEQDKILDSLEKYDVLMIFNMLEQAPHTQYIQYSTTDWDWDYDTYNEFGQYITEPWIYDKQRYCYNDQPQGQKKPHESLTNESDLLYHKQRTRYYLARYGYSTKIMEFEILSEPFHVGERTEIKDKPGNLIMNQDQPYIQGTIVKDAIYNYHKVLSEYMKDSLHINQLVGVNMGHGSSIDLQSSGLQSIDVVGVNFYYTSPALSEYANNEIAKKIWDYRGNKIPILFTEGGVDEDYKLCSDYSQNPVDMMTMSFSSVGGHFSWYGWRKETESHLWPATIRAQNHMNGPDVIATLSDGSGEWWHDMDAAERDKYKKYAVENQYYVSQNQTSAVGYVKNRTYNIATQDAQILCDVDLEKDVYKIVQLTSWDDVIKGERIRVEHLRKKTDYQVHWYTSYYLLHNGYVKTDCMKTKKRNGKWGFVLEYPKLGESEAGNAQFPVYWYVIQEGCSSGIAQQPTQERENEFNEILVVDQLENSKITVYPNPFETSFTVNSLTDDQLIIQTLEGKIVGAFDIEKGENRVSLPGISKGVYICKLKHQVFTFKLLKL